MLIVLSADPNMAATLLPHKIRHKQLLELMQMISCVVDFGYKPIPQGKELKAWIEKNAGWVYVFAKRLRNELDRRLAPETRCKYDCLLELLRFKANGALKVPDLKTAIFRYAKEYAPNTIYLSNSELPITEAVPEYRKYVIWKDGLWQSEVFS